MPVYVDEKTENIKISYEVMANVKKILFGCQLREGTEMGLDQTWVTSSYYIF